MPTDAELEQAELLRLIQDQHAEWEQTKLFRLYPDTGPLRRELYKKHMEFFSASSIHQEVCFMAANRVGKTLAGCYALTCHLLNWYAPWWPGIRFSRPITVWAAGEDTKAVRDSLQVTLFGQPGALGTGTIPKKYILNTTARSGVPEAVDSASIKCENGGVSRLTLKSYDQGRESYQGAKIDVMLFDEEPPIEIYSEGLTRTLSTTPGERSGIVLCTFTPLKGLSAVALSFMPGGQRLEGAVS